MTYIVQCSLLPGHRGAPTRNRALAATETTCSLVREGVYQRKGLGSAGYFLLHDEPLRHNKMRAMLSTLDSQRGLHHSAGNQQQNKPPFASHRVWQTREQASLSFTRDEQGLGLCWPPRGNAIRRERRRRKASGQERESTARVPGPAAVKPSQHPSFCLSGPFLQIPPSFLSPALPHTQLPHSPSASAAKPSLQRTALPSAPQPPKSPPAAFLPVYGARLSLLSSCRQA